MSSALGGIISRWGTTYSVARTARGSITNGNYSSGAGTTVSITAMVQPVSGDRLRVMPEGLHAEDVKIVFSLDELYTTGPAYEADKITIEGTQWIVFAVERWSAWGHTHWEAQVSNKVVS